MPISTPDKIITPFATSGLKDNIPQNSDPINGRAGYDQGFPPINLTPRTAGGIPPFGQDMNGIFFDVTEAVRFQQAGGSFPYDSTWATAVGGYPVGALISRTDNQGLWLNTSANNTTDPESFGAGWVPGYTYGAASVTMTNANVTLTALQAGRPVIVITGVLTADLNLIFPTWIKSWSILNSTTGSFNITAKTAAGAGVIVPQANAANVVGNGTNIYNASGNVPASETVAGISEIATQAETDSGTDDARFVTPLKLKSGFSISLGTVGHIKLPSFLGGFIVQWGTGVTAAGANIPVTLSMTFPNAIYSVVCTLTTASPARGVNVVAKTTSSITVESHNSTGTKEANPYTYITIGS